MKKKVLLIIVILFALCVGIVAMNTGGDSNKTNTKEKFTYVKKTKDTLKIEVNENGDSFINDISLYSVDLPNKNIVYKGKELFTTTDLKCFKYLSQGEYDKAFSLDTNKLSDNSFIYTAGYIEQTMENDVGNQHSESINMNELKKAYKVMTSTKTVDYNHSNNYSNMKKIILAFEKIMQGDCAVMDNATDYNVTNSKWGNFTKEHKYIQSLYNLFLVTDYIYNLEDKDLKNNKEKIENSKDYGMDLKKLEYDNDNNEFIINIVRLYGTQSKKGLAKVISNKDKDNKEKVEYYESYIQDKKTEHLAQGVLDDLDDKDTTQEDKTQKVRKDLYGYSDYRIRINNGESSKSLAKGNYSLASHYVISRLTREGLNVLYSADEVNDLKSYVDEHQTKGEHLYIEPSTREALYSMIKPQSYDYSKVGSKEDGMYSVRNFSKAIDIITQEEKGNFMNKLAVAIDAVNGITY